MGRRLLRHFHSVCLWRPASIHGDPILTVNPEFPNPNCQAKLGGLHIYSLHRKGQSRLQQLNLTLTLRLLSLNANCNATPKADQAAAAATSLASSVDAFNDAMNNVTLTQTVNRSS